MALSEGDDARSEQPRDVPWVDGRLFNENFNKYPAEELLRHAGQYVAFNLDATCILTSAAEELELFERLKEMGIDPGWVVVDYIDPPDVPLLAGNLDCPADSFGDPAEDAGA
jgi:hypothetical protein